MKILNANFAAEKQDSLIADVQLYLQSVPDTQWVDRDDLVQAVPAAGALEEGELAQLLINAGIKVLA